MSSAASVSLRRIVILKFYCMQGLCAGSVCWCEGAVLIEMHMVMDCSLLASYFKAIHEASKISLPF